MLTIKSIPAFNDNYIWLVQNDDNRCAVIDPGDASPVIEDLKDHDLILEAILITHHHNDHIGGIHHLKSYAPDIKILGPAAESIAQVTHPLTDGDQFSLFNHDMRVLGLPGHTSGHIGYYGDGKLFCGDVLFSAGCGRVFEGTYEQMFQSLTRLTKLPDETLVYAAHEYTTSNITFALAVEPDNEKLIQYKEEVQQLRSNHIPTLPTTLGLEKAINPFLRVQQPGIIKSLTNRTEDMSPLGVFSALRDWKNEF